MFYGKATLHPSHETEGNDLTPSTYPMNHAGATMEATRLNLEPYTFPIWFITFKVPSSQAWAQVFHQLSRHWTFVKLETSEKYIPLTREEEIWRTFARPTTQDMLKKLLPTGSNFQLNYRERRMRLHITTPVNELPPYKVKDNALIFRGLPRVVHMGKRTVPCHYEPV